MLDLTQNLELAQADHLDAAADYLERYGWCQRTPYDVSGAACATGALTATTDLNPKFNAPQSTLALAAGLHALLDEPLDCNCGLLSCASNTVQSWNDRAATTKDDVIAAMQKTAAALREKVR